MECWQRLSCVETQLFISTVNRIICIPYNMQSGVSYTLRCRLQCSIYIFSVTMSHGVTYVYWITSFQFSPFVYFDERSKRMLPPKKVLPRQFQIKLILLLILLAIASKIQKSSTAKLCRANCRASITSSSTIPIWWLSFWRIWRYDVLQYDVVYSVMPMHFRVLYFPNFFRIYKNPVKFQLTKFFRKTKKRKMHRHGRVRNFISVLLSHWTSKTIQASNWDSAPTQFYLSWCLQPVA